MKFKMVLVMLCFSASMVKSQGLDVKLLDKLNPNTTNVNKTWDFITDKAIPVSIATPFVMLGVGMIEHNAELKQNAINTGVALLGSTFITFGMKSAIQRQRPFLAYSDKIMLQGNTDGFSFPSGHTSTAFSVATSLSLSCPKWYVIVPSYTFAAATAYSRMYRGAHYPSDVLGGMIVGAGSSYLTWKLQKLIYKKRHSRVYATN